MIKKIVLKSRTPFSSMFTADQIWGQFIWAVSDLEGQEKATETVRLYENGTPPIRFSSLMIDGYLPKPQYVTLFPNSSKDAEKSNKKCKWLSYKDFAELQKDCRCFSEKEISPLGKKAVRNVQELHVSISNDNLYNVIYKFSECPLVIYADYADGRYEDRLQKVIEYWEKTGLGGDRNVGRGQFDIEMESLSAEEEEIFKYSDGNGFVSLSESFGPDLVPLYYSLDVYSGFVGRKTAESVAYRKKPVVRYLPGSFFRSGEGSILRTVDNRDIFSYGLTFPVPMKVEVEND